MWSLVKQALKRKILLGVLGSACLAFALVVIIVVGSRYFLNTNSVTVLSESTLLEFSLPDATSTAVGGSAVTSTSYRLQIPKIGVDMPIVYNEKNEQKALMQGAWLLPGSAVPWNNDVYNNSVISAHRYQYLSGPNTFFNLDKLVAGDRVMVFGENVMFEYEVVESKIVAPTQVSVLLPSKSPQITLLTCHPVFSTKERLIVVARKL